MRVDVPGQVLVACPDGLHFLPMHTMIPDPLNGLRGFFNEALHQRSIDAPVVVFAHPVEFLKLRQLHAGLLLHEGFNSEGAFHEVAGAARKGILFQKNRLQTGFLSARGSNRTARAGTDHNHISIEHAVCHCRDCHRHSEGGNGNGTNEFLHISLLDSSAFLFLVNMTNKNLTRGNTNE